MKKWLDKYFVTLLIIASILFAVIIHVLFHWTNGPFWLQAKWSAGDILTYSSTVALGLLAVWQNKRYKEESFTAQERLEKLTKQANEITTINLIVGNESLMLSKLKEVLVGFSAACDPAEIGINRIRAHGNEVEPHDRETAIIIRVTNQQRIIRDNLLAVCAALQISPEKIVNSRNSFLKSLSDCYSAAKEVLEKMSESPLGGPPEEYDVLAEKWNAYEVERERIVRNMAESLDKIIYGNMTIEQIKEVVRSELRITP